MEVVRIGAESLDEIEPLWISMVEHHRKVIGHEIPVRPAPEAWARRRAEYESWLADGSGTLFVARDERPVGYAFLTVHQPGATFDLGEPVGEVESLAVAADQRGAGVGTALLEACRSELRSRGVGHWAIAVVEANEDAVRLYEREGFKPFYRTLLGPL